MSKTQTTFWFEAKIDHLEMLRVGVLKQSSWFPTSLWIQAHFTVHVLMVLRAFRRLFLISLRSTYASHFLNEISPMVWFGKTAMTSFANAPYNVTGIYYIVVGSNVRMKSAGFSLKKIGTFCVFSNGDISSAIWSWIKIKISTDMYSSRSVHFRGVFAHILWSWGTLRVF